MEKGRVKGLLILTGGNSRRFWVCNIKYRGQDLTGKVLISGKYF